MDQRFQNHVRVSFQAAKCLIWQKVMAFELVRFVTWHCALLAMPSRSRYLARQRGQEVAVRRLSPAPGFDKRAPPPIPNTHIAGATVFANLRYPIPSSRQMECESRHLSPWFH